MPARRSLRDLLVEDGLLDAATIEAGERAARRLGLSLAAALLEERLIEAAELLDLLRRRLTLAEVDLDRLVVEPEAIREVPLTLAETHCLLPLALERQGGRAVIRVAFADPLDATACEEIEFATGCRVEPVVALATDIAAAVKRHYRGVVTKLIRDVPAARQALGEAAEARAPAQYTEPGHHLEDEATPEQRIRAVVNALVRRGLLTEDDYLDELREILKHRDE
jgi:hypothetical protein